MTGPAGEKWEVYTVLADSDRSAPHRRMANLMTTFAAATAASER